MLKKLLTTLLLVLSFSLFVAGKKREDLTAPQILLHIDKQLRKINKLSLQFAIMHKSDDGKILKTLRRGLKYKKNNNLFTHLRWDLTFPEKIAFLVTPSGFFKYNLSSGSYEENLPYLSESADTKDPKAQTKLQKSILRKINSKAKELLRDFNWIGAELPDPFNKITYIRRAEIVKEIIYRSRLCWIISMKVRKQTAQFWITKDKLNLLKYEVITEEVGKEVVEIIKKRKISDTITIPTQVKLTKTFIDPEKITENIYVKYYGFKVNRPLPVKAFQFISF